MTGLADRLRSTRWLRAEVLALPLFAVFWQSFFWFDRVPIAAKAVYAALTLLAAVRPRDALLVVAGLASLGSPIGLLIHAPAGRTAEALVVAFLVGWLSHLVWRRESILEPRDTLRIPSAVFAVVVLASLAIAASAVQSALAPPWPFIRDVATMLARDYFGGPNFETHNWYPAALLVEGCLLVAAAVRLTRHRAELQVAIARMLAAGIVAAALIAWARLAAWLIRSPEPMALLGRVVTSIRMSGHMADLNAAGSHIVLALPVVWALGTLARRAHAGRVAPAAWSIADLALLGPLWLTGSRAAQFSILLTVAVAAAIAARRRRAVVWSGLALAVLAIVAAVIALRPGPESSVYLTLRNRWLFNQMSWEMFVSSPAFGVGVGEYFSRSAALMPQGLRSLYIAENAHNNFFQIGVELGLVGFCAFAWWVIVAARRIFSGFLAGRRDVLLSGLVMGLFAAMLTFLVGHPLLVGAFAFSFWITLGLAVARADTLVDTDGSASDAVPVHAPRRSRWQVSRRMATIAVIAFILMLPLRAYLKRDRVDLSGVRYGFESGGVDQATDSAYQWAGPLATIFAPSYAQSVLVSVSQASPAEAIALDIRIDGRLVNQVVLRDGFWRDMRLLLPVTRPTHAFRRMDIGVRRLTEEEPSASFSASEDGEARVRIRRIEIR